MVKNLPTMQATWVRSLGGEDPLEKRMVTHSTILAWKIPRTKEPGGLQSMGCQRIRHNWVANFLFYFFRVSLSINKGRIYSDTLSVYKKTLLRNKNFGLRWDDIKLNALHPQSWYSRSFANCKGCLKMSSEDGAFSVSSVFQISCESLSLADSDLEFYW